MLNRKQCSAIGVSELLSSSSPEWITLEGLLQSPSFNFHHLPPRSSLKLREMQEARILVLLEHAPVIVLLGLHLSALQAKQIVDSLNDAGSFQGHCVPNQRLPLLVHCSQDFVKDGLLDSYQLFAELAFLHIEPLHSDWWLAAHIQRHVHWNMERTDTSGSQQAWRHAVEALLPREVAVFLVANVGWNDLLGT
jgi:hypothetical protein